MSTLVQVKADIIERLTDAKVSTIVLVGDAGMGKTWMAREISEFTIKEGWCYATLWVYVTENYNINLFYQDIARQYGSLSPITEEWEYKEEKRRADPAEDMIENLKKRIQAKLKKIGQALSVEKKYLLLVLDDVGNNLVSNNDLHVKLPEEWKSMVPSKFHNRFKIMITTRNILEGSEVIKFPQKLQLNESLMLLKNSLDKKVAENRRFQELNLAIAKKSEGKPAAIIVIAKALNYVAKNYDYTLGPAISKVANYEGKLKGVNLLFHCACKMIKSSVTRSCFWHSMNLFHKYGGVNYDELITHWIMEGYLDPFNQVEEAYWKGYDVLIELIDRALLKIQENNIVVVEEGVLNVIDSSPLEFNGTAALRLFSVFDDNKSLGRVTRMNGMIKTLCNPKFWEKNSTLLMDNSHITGEVHHQSIFNSMKELKVLAVFKARCGQSFISALSKMDRLLVLVLRTCDLVDDIANINQLKTLKVLEISGDSLLISMPEDLFDGMTSLQRLYLSGLKLIESLPSFSKLSELRVLILSRCSRLKKLKSLEGLGKLQLLDISDATSFETFDDPTLSVLPKIQKIDLSNTNIRSLPEFGELKELTQIFLSGCRNLRNIPKLELVTRLQILDLSGATRFKTFADQSIEKLEQLRIIDLSTTSIGKVPYIPRNGLDLKLTGCYHLEELPSTISGEHILATR